MLSAKMHMATIECVVEGEGGVGTEVITETMKETIEVIIKAVIRGIITVDIRGIINGATWGIIKAIRGIIKVATLVIIQGATKGIIKKMMGIQTIKVRVMALVLEVIAITENLTQDIPPVLNNLAGKKCAFQVKVSSHNLDGRAGYTVARLSEIIIPPQNIPPGDSNEEASTSKKQKIN